MNSRPPCIFGEVLFDHFPDGARVLGGAPFNVAWHLQAFGRSPLFVSRVGNDDEGHEIRQAMQAWGMRVDALQTDPTLATGSVAVSFTDGEPHYDIVHPCAYDVIEPVTANGCDLLYHGSLAIRDTQSRSALQALIDSAKPGRVFLDVNLRAPWWDRDTLQQLLVRADWVKLNADELRLLHDDDNAEGFLGRHALAGLILTRGSAGAEVLTADGQRHGVSPQPATSFVDAVGAGDAFASVFILGLLSDWQLPTTLQRAQAFASAIVGQRGATVSDRGFYRAFAEQWQL